MHWLKVALIIDLLLVFGLAGVYVGHDIGYSSGHSDGYDTGRIQGHIEGIENLDKIGNARYEAGYQTGQQEGYSDGLKDGEELAKADIRSENVRRDDTFTASSDYRAEIDGYDIYVEWFDKIGQRNDKDIELLGYTHFDDDIYIRTEQTVESLYVTCVHEKLHNLHPDADQEWVYNESTERVDDTCLRLLYAMNHDN